MPGLPLVFGMKYSTVSTVDVRVSCVGALCTQNLGVRYGKEISLARWPSVGSVDGRQFSPDVADRRVSFQLRGD